MILKREIRIIGLDIPMERLISMGITSEQALLGARRIRRMDQCPALIRIRTIGPMIGSPVFT